MYRILLLHFIFEKTRFKVLSRYYFDNKLMNNMALSI